MRKTYSEELDALHVRFYQMGQLVYEAVHKAITAFIEQDSALAEQVISGDSRINQMEATLEYDSIQLIALQQPVSTDLRKIVTVMKATADLERMGDHAVSISKAALEIIGEKRQPEIEEQLQRIATKVNQMIQEVLDAYVATDEEHAIQTAESDAEVDELTNQVHSEIIHRLKTDSSIAKTAAHNMMTATYLERIGDYVTNIAEWIVFVRSGEMRELNPHHSNRK